MLSWFSHVTPCNLMGYSPPGSSVHGILQVNSGVGCQAFLQAQALNPSLLHLLQLQTGSLPLAPPWKPYLFIYLSKFIYSHPPIIINLLLLLLSYFSCVRLCATPETAAHQAPPSLGFSRQEHWSGLPFPSHPPIYIIIYEECPKMYKWGIKVKCLKTIIIANKHHKLFLPCSHMLSFQMSKAYFPYFSVATASTVRRCGFNT